LNDSIADRRCVAANIEALAYAIYAAARATSPLLL
jgi:hypothetical protein